MLMRTKSNVCYESLFEILRLSWRFHVLVRTVNILWYRVTWETDVNELKMELNMETTHFQWFLIWSVHVKPKIGTQFCKASLKSKPLDAHGNNTNDT